MHEGCDGFTDSLKRITDEPQQLPYHSLWTLSTKLLFFVSIVQNKSFQHFLTVADSKHREPVKNSAE